MPIDLAGLKKANETGFALIAVVQGAEATLKTVEAASNAASDQAKVTCEATIATAQKAFEAARVAAMAARDATIASEQAKVKVAGKAKDDAEASLQTHQAETQKKYGTTLDFGALLGKTPTTGGRTRL